MQFFVSVNGDAIFSVILKLVTTIFFVFGRSAANQEQLQFMGSQLTEKLISLNLGPNPYVNCSIFFYSVNTGVFTSHVISQQSPFSM